MNKTPPDSIQDRKEPQAELIRTLGEQLTVELAEGGELKSPNLKRLFSSKARGSGLSWDEVAVREELFYLAWDLCGRSYAELKRVTGMHHSSAERILAKARRTIQQNPNVARAVEAGEALLIEDRYRGRRHMIDELNQGALDAIRFGMEQLEAMKPYEAIRAAGIMIDKSLLLSGQPTSRVAKVDERGLTDQQLESELEALTGEAQRLGIVEGGKGAAES